MKTLAKIGTLLLAAGLQPATADEGWVALFDGKSLEGWKASENPATFRVEDGRIVADGPRAHLFYAGPVQNHDFRNFEFKAEVMTTPGSNSGIYFHTEYEETGWPSKGYEVQVNNTHRDPRKTGSLYAVQDVHEAPARDGEWFTEQVIVQGRRIVIKVNDKVLVDYTEPENPAREESMKGRVLSRGTFALQGHDPKSKVYYRNLMVKPLP
ncbi:MAG TPA: DUF1080 domain-containing protein [Vicinamibacteria bacterium]|nr:DUF1080 domain-containing protein [Vicinamibacteria bacterium]